MILLAKSQEMQNFNLLLFIKMKYIGIWNDYKEGKVFVSLNFQKNSPFIFSMTLSDHKPNLLMFNSMKKYNFWKLFIDNFKCGLVYFENQKIKYNMIELIKQFIANS